MTIITDEKYLRVSNEMVVEEEKVENNKLMRRMPYTCDVFHITVILLNYFKIITLK